MSDAVWDPSVSTEAIRSVIDECVAVAVPYLTSNGVANPFDGLSSRISITSSGEISASENDLGLLRNLGVGGRHYPATHVIELIQDCLTEEFEALKPM